MKRRSTSITIRAAWAAFASAGFAAAIAAISAIALADLLVLRQTDRHLVAAATELSREVGTANDVRKIEKAVRDEQEEATSTGIRFVVYGSEGQFLTGDTNVQAIREPCATVRDLRICNVPAAAGTQVHAATLRETAYGLLSLAALVAAALAGVVAWGIGRVLSRHAVGPLTRLRARIANMPLDGRARTTLRPESLGADEGVSEVDELRAALVTLLGRMHDAIDRSSQFAANAAHEFRTPLTSLRAELELMAEAETAGNDQTTSDPSRRRSLEVALRKVAQLQSLTERLLALATPDGGADGFEIVSMRDVIDEVVASLASEERSRVMIADEADLFVHGDSDALGIAVSNGITNALKFGTHVTVELSAADALAIVAIEDDGPGVPEDERTRVFDPFARGGAAKGLPGHGLGLALVAHVAKRHRGRACLANPRRGSQGARLEIRIPLVEGSQDG